MRSGVADDEIPAACQRRHRGEVGHVARRQDGGRAVAHEGGELALEVIVDLRRARDPARPRGTETVGPQGGGGGGDDPWGVMEAQVVVGREVQGRARATGCARVRIRGRADEELAVQAAGAAVPGEAAELAED